MFCVVITFFAVTLSERVRELVLQARSGYYIAVLLNRADAVMPAELHEVLDPYLHRLEKELEPASTAPVTPPPAAASPAATSPTAAHGS